MAVVKQDKKRKVKASKELNSALDTLAKPRKKSNRRLVTEILTRAATHYWAHKRYSCHIEFGIEKWGKRRLDLIALNTKGVLIGCEVKSCAADYRTDNKWKAYLPYVNKMYMVFSEKLYNNEKFMKKAGPELKEHGVGIMVLSEKSGYIYVAKNAKSRDVDPNIVQSMLMRMAWRGGESKRTIPRRRRLYIES